VSKGRECVKTNIDVFFTYFAHTFSRNPGSISPCFPRQTRTSALSLAPLAQDRPADTTHARVEVPSVCRASGQNRFGLHMGSCRTRYLRAMCQASTPWGGQATPETPATSSPIRTQMEYSAPLSPPPVQLRPSAVCRVDSPPTMLLGRGIATLCVGQFGEARGG
jgi:hypothetical protein